MLSRTLLVVIISLTAFQCSAQIDRLDTFDLYLTFQGNIMDTFELEHNENEINTVVMALHVQGNYLQCILENHTDSTFSLFNSCGQLKTIIERKDGTIDYPGGCDYDGNNYRALYPKTGFNIYIPKSPFWIETEIRAGLYVNGRRVYSNWVRYE